MILPAARRPWHRIIMKILSLMAASVVLMAAADPDVVSAQRRVREQLREPQSARFLDVYAATTPNVRGEPTRVVCGKVSARNGAGGMSNAVRFVVNLTSGRASFDNDDITLERDEMRIGRTVVTNFCRR